MDIRQCAHHTRLDEQLRSGLRHVVGRWLCLTPSDVVATQVMGPEGGSLVNAMSPNGMLSGTPSTTAMTAATPFAVDALGAGGSLMNGNAPSDAVREANSLGVGLGYNNSISSNYNINNNNHNSTINVSGSMTNIVGGSMHPVMASTTDGANVSVSNTYNTSNSNSNNNNALSASMMDHIAKVYRGSQGSVGGGSSTSASGMYDMTQLTMNPLAPRSPLNHSALFSREVDRRLGIHPGYDKYANLTALPEPAAQEHDDVDSPKELHSFGNDTASYVTDYDANETPHSDTTMDESRLMQSARSFTSAVSSRATDPVGAHGRGRVGDAVYGGAMNAGRTGALPPAPLRYPTTNHTSSSASASSPYSSRTRERAAMGEEDVRLGSAARPPLPSASIDHSRVVSLWECESSAFVTPMEKDSSPSASRMTHTTSGGAERVIRVRSAPPLLPPRPCPCPICSRTVMCRRRRRRGVSGEPAGIVACPPAPRRRVRMQMDR